VAQLAGKVALISGAARGMGANEAVLFASEGAAVMIADLIDERGRETVAEIAAKGGEADYCHLDVTDPAGWQSAVEQVRTWKGRLDILVNNAGITVRDSIDEISLADWNKVLAVNLTGSMLGIKYAAPLMRSGGGGAVVNISSIVGMTGSTFAGYAASKWGVRGLTKSAALEYAPWNIRVNAICPGVVETDINRGQPYIEPLRQATPLGRIATTNDVAKLALFLASDASSAITGHEHVIDGGYTAGIAVARKDGA
jgi:3alpha(or 20beta)-hydroxysteroid dehydrogenase